MDIQYFFFYFVAFAALSPFAFVVFTIQFIRSRNWKKLQAEVLKEVQKDVTQEWSGIHCSAYFLFGGHLIGPMAKAQVLQIPNALVVFIKRGIPLSPVHFPPVVVTRHPELLSKKLKNQAVRKICKVSQLLSDEIEIDISHKPDSMGYATLSFKKLDEKKKADISQALRTIDRREV